MPRVKYLNIVVISIMFAALAGKSCSVEKNTAATRAYHNLVSHYNIYFNGKESYLEGIRRARESFTDDYTNILPLFYYEDESIQQNVSPQMKRAMDKATKLITFHSITSKPKIKQGRQSAKDKAFYEKNEYNKWVDDSYMLIGKAYMYQGEFFMAAESFKHVINNFPEEEIYYAAIAWLMRAYNVIGDFDKSEELSMALKDAEELPKDYLEDINLSLADYYLRLEEYEDAVQYIKKALDTRPEKSSRIRLNYILAQLYNEIGDGELSIKHYKKVIRMNPPYEMTFNSKVSMAEAFQAGSSNSNEIKKLLFKMLKDSKNEEFQDQIYFALGNILMEEGEREQAIEYYHLSVTTSVRNDYQKGQSCLTLAEIYYSEPKYTLSAAYYDTAVNLLDPEFPNYENLQMRSSSLSTLVTNLNTYQLQDSLQRLASMTEEERFTVIDAVIADVREQEELERQRQQQAMQDLQFSRSGMMNQSANSGNNQQSGSKWYFYNLNLKSYGQPEFRMKWGDRKLEDNWRRRNKQSVSEIMQTEGNEEVTENGESVQVLDDKSREYYIRDIPLTDSAMEVSHRRLEEALYHVGLVYKNDLLDYDEAISAFEELIQRYPQGNYTMASYYYLYELYNAVQNISKANYYKERLSTEYPDSHMAKLLTNPNYIRELEAEQQKVEDFYMKAYTAYKNENFNQVISLANQGIENYPDDEGLQQRLSYLKAMSTGAVYGKEAMKNELDSLIAHYPGTELANEAQEVKDYMFVAFPVMEKIEKAQEAEVLYHFDTTATHYFLLALKTSENLNLVNFNLLNYNLDNFNA
ncbi:MAG TPA: tetratricopeptide repeat protein, partial [Bacteroidales bacterium]|nr:tetratricopeptide repeat protein [Bacteroidales bacterium]